MLHAPADAAEPARDIIAPVLSDAPYAVKEAIAPRTPHEELAYQLVQKAVSGETDGLAVADRLFGGPFAGVLKGGIGGAQESLRANAPLTGVLTTLEPRVAADIGLDLLHNKSIEDKAHLCGGFLENISLWQGAGPAADKLLRHIFITLSQAADPVSVNFITSEIDSWRPLYAGKPWAGEVDKKLTFNSLLHKDTATSLSILSRLQDSLSAKDLASLRLSGRATSAIALLAYNQEPLYPQLEADPALVHIDDIDRALVLPLVQNKKVGADFWEVTLQALRSADDFSGTTTAKARLAVLRNLSARWGWVDPIELEQSAAYVARNLYMKQLAPSAAAVKEEVRAIQQERQRISRELLFNNDILVLSHDEVMLQTHNIFVKQGDPRFGTSVLIDALKKRQAEAGASGKTFTHLTPLVQKGGRYKATAQSTEAAKTKTLEIVATSVRPLTVFLDGHGSEDAFYLSSGQVQNGVVQAPPTEDARISVADMARALADRWELQKMQDPGATELNVSFVFSACFMQNFARSLAESLERRGVPLPHLMLSASDYGQYGFSNFNDIMGSLFNSLVAKSSTVGDIIQGKKDLRNQAPSMFVPRKDDPHKLMQVSGIVVAQPTTAVA